MPSESPPTKELGIEGAEMFISHSSGRKMAVKFPKVINIYLQLLKKNKAQSECLNWQQYGKKCLYLHKERAVHMPTMKAG